jgi:hypothetical protein
MANILGLALKVTGDASGLAKSLTPVDRALDQLAKQAEKATAVFNPFLEKTAAAGKAQEEFATKLATLSQQLKDNVIGPKEYAAAFGQLTEEAQSVTKAFERGIEVTQRYTTVEEKRAMQLQEIADLLQQGAISEQTAARARAELSGDAARLAAEEKKIADARAAAARITAANMAPMELYDREVQQLSEHLQAGRISQETFDRAVAKATSTFTNAESSAKGYDKTVGSVGLKFNELSGVLAALPGPLGGFAARLSGLASASEGLTRVFGAGLSPGLQSIGQSFAAIATPVNVGLAAVAGFGLAATGIVRGLATLEARLEALGNTALRLGTDFQTIQVLNEAAQRTGQSIDAVATGLQKFNVNLDEARKGSGPAAEAFARLGISQERLRTNDTPGLAKEVADALQGIEDPAKRAAIAVDILGKNGLTLLPVFNALQESQTALERFAAGISQLDQQRVSTLGKAFDNVKTSLAGFGQAVLLPFAGVVEGFANLVADAVGAVTRLAQAIGTVLTPVLDTFGNGLSLVGDGIFAVSSLFDGWLGNTENAKAAVSDLRQVVEEPLDGGFAKEFEQTLRRITSSVGDAINESAKFGQAGFDAALRYQTSINELKAKLDAGLFNEETFRREAEKAGVAFKEELAKIEENAQLDIQINADAEKTLAGLQQQINKAVEGAQQFGQAGFDAAAQFQDKLRDLGAQFEDGRINAATLAAETEKATAEYNKQIEGLKQIEELQKRTLEAERNRIAELLKAGDTTTQLERDMDVVLREQLRLEEEIRKQREAGNVFAADAAAGRLAQLDQLQARLEEQQQAVDQGFADGFAKTFEATKQSIDGLIGKAEEFGNAGALAFDALRAGVERAQQQAKDGILTQETYQREVARQQDLFNQRLAAVQRVEDFMMSKMDERQRAELEATKQLEERKKQAAVNVQAIEAKIIDEKKKLEEARSGNDLKAARAAQANITQLNQARLQEQRIANGQGQAAQRQQMQQNGSLARMQQFQGLIAQQNSNFLKSFQDTYAGANSAIAAANAAAEQQQRKLQQILTPGPRTVQGADIRTAEGAALVIGLAANELDPALIEARQQTKQLKAIQQAIIGTASSYLNTPVEIV